MELQSLPDELILEIERHLDPVSAVRLSFCCRRMHRCLCERLDVYRDFAVSQNWVQHDRNPTTILDLARLAISGDLESWFVTRLELWGIRLDWGWWKSYEDFNPPSSASRTGEDHFHYTHLDGSLFEPEEIEAYRCIMEDDLHFSPEQAEQWIERLQAGDDQLLRLIALAKFPSLSYVSMMTFFMLHGFVQLLSSIVRSMVLAKLPYCSWPVGFRSIRTLLINLPVNYGLGSISTGARIAKYDIIPFFFLPNLRRLRVDAFFHTGNPTDSALTIPDRSSAIEHYTEGGQGLKFSDYLEFARGVKTLKCMSIYGCSDADQKDIQKIVDLHGATLECINFYRGAISVTLEQAALCPNLKYFHIGLDWIISQREDGWTMLSSFLPRNIVFISIGGVVKHEKQARDMFSGVILLASRRGLGNHREETNLQDICLNVVGATGSRDRLHPAGTPLAEVLDEGYQICEVACEHYGIKFHYFDNERKKICKHRERHLYQEHISRAEFLHSSVKPVTENR